MSCRNKITHKPLQKAIISFLTHIITGDGNLRVAPVVVAQNLLVPVSKDDNI